MTPEGKVKKEIKAWLKGQGAYFFMPVQTGYGAATVDFLVCLHGVFVGIETKAPGKKPTPRQELVMHAITAAGGNAYCVTSLEDFLTQSGFPG